MNRSYAFVSTCSLDGWGEYGEKFVKSFIDHYPSDTHLYMYIDFKPSIYHDRVTYRNIADCYGLDNFQNYVKSLKFSRGKTIVSDLHEQAHNPNIIWNAAKFSFKVFSVEHCVINSSHDIVTWIDADTIAFQNIDTDFISSIIPPYCLLNYLGRGEKYTECGYVSYNKQHPLCEKFVQNFSELFRSGAIFSMKEWHDSYIFDLLRYVYEKYYNVVDYNISFEVMDYDHVFINSSLGRYLDHLKGPRKTEGRSLATDLKTNHATTYWAFAQE